MEKLDLSLIPIDVLIKEAESRCTNFILAYTAVDPQEKGSDWFYYGQGKRAKSVQLAADLLNDVQNNWSGEMRTLQRLNDMGAF